MRKEIFIIRRTPSHATLGEVTASVKNHALNFYKTTRAIRIVE